MKHAILHSTPNRYPASPAADFEAMSAVGVRRVMKKFLGVSLFCLYLAAQAWGQSLSFEPDSVFLGSYGQDYELTDTIEVTADGEWTAFAGADWLTLGTVAGDGSNVTLDDLGNLSGDGNGRFTVRVLHNTGASERTGVIYVVDREDDNTQPISVTQDWGSVVVAGIKYARVNPHVAGDLYLSVVGNGGGYSGAIFIPDTLEYHSGKYIPARISDQAFAGCSGLTSITLPNTVKEIGDSAFYGCGKLTSIKIPASVTEIGYAAFYGCKKIASINLPGSLTEIGAFAFANAAALRTLEVGWNTPPDYVGWDYGTPSESSIFHGEYGGSYSEIDFVNCKLVVPTGTVGIYENALIWEKFREIDEAKLTVVADTLAFDADETGDTIIAVASDVVAWTAVKEPADAEWLTLTNASGSGDGVFTVAIAANDGAAREAMIIIAGTSAVSIADTIYVTQGATSAVNLSVDSLFFEADETGDTTIIVTSYTAWTVEKDSSWIILDPESPSGSEHGSFTVTVEENPGLERSGKIFVINEASIDSIVVTQATSRKIVLSVDDLAFGIDENLEATVDVMAYVDWTITVSEDATWLTVDPTEGTGEESFNVTATPNDGTEVREALIIVASESHSDTIYVKQAAVINVYLRFEEDGVYYYAPDTTVSADVEVVAPGKGAYSGKVVIPSTVTHLEKIYDVKSIRAEAFAGSDITYLALPLSLESVGADAFKDCASLDSVKILWKSTDDAYPDNISFAFTDVEVSDVTLIVPAGTKESYQVARFWGLFNIEEAEIPAGIDKATEGVAVRAESGRLYVDSPAAETVYVYSFTGKLLRTATKASGQATLDIPAEKLLIVRGSNGWARKIMAN